MTIKRMKEITSEYFDGYKVGDIISFNLDDEEVEAMAVHKVEDGMVFALVDCLKDAKPMKRGSFDLNEWLNTELLEKFEGLLRKNMIPFEDGSMVRLMSETEVFGEVIWSRDDEVGEQYEAMKLRRNRICGQLVRFRRDLIRRHRIRFSRLLVYGRRHFRRYALSCSIFRSYRHRRLKRNERQQHQKRQHQSKNSFHYGVPPHTYV